MGSHRSAALAVLACIGSVLFIFDTAALGGGVPGACCDPTTLACTIRDETSCVAIGGIFMGDNTPCSACTEAPVVHEIYTVEDTFELLAPPEATYGSAGALNVSGSQARNYQNIIRGITDTWMKFDPSSAIAQFDSVFGAGQWVLTSAVLRLHEDAAPNHPIFGIGGGQFTIRWMANDNWAQGTGIPNSPGVATGNLIGFTYGRSILDNATDETLGTTFQNALVTSWQNFTLPLTPGFTSDLMTPGPVSLYLVATDTRTGFTFNSGSHPNYPKLILTAEPAPEPVCRGDVTGDGLVRGDDIQPWVDGYLDAGSLTPEQFARIDMNNSGTLSAADIDCFVDALLSLHDCGDGPFACL